MVGKTPQVREIVYNVLDDNGDRTVIAKGASTVDVGDTEQLFARTSDIEVLSSNTFSNVSNLQSNVIELETFLSSISFPGGQGVYQPILSVLEQNHVSNAARVEILESIHTSNVVHINGNFSNITILQDDVNSNVTRIETLESIHVSNVTNINGNFSNIFIISENLSDNVTRIVSLEDKIEAVTDFGDITGLQSNVTSLLTRVGGATVRIGTLSGGSSNGGPGNSANSAIAIGDNAGAHMGNRSIAIGGFSGFNTQAQQASQTERSIVISAQSDPLRATRTDTLVISPMIEDNSNTIQMMGYNLTSNELVNTSLLKLLSDSNIHSTTNVYISNETVDGTTKIDIDGNGSFGGNIDINATLDVGGASSFGGAMTLNNNLETIGTSSFGGKMQVNNDIDCNGESFIMKNGFANKIIFREDGTGSFLSKVEVNASGNSTTASPAFEVAGASVFKSDVKIGDAGTDNLEVVGTSSFGGDMKVNTHLVMTTGSFTMNNGSNDLIKLQTNGTSSFAGQMETSGIDVTSGTVDLYHAGAALRVGPDSSTFRATINSDGTSSFLAAMQINNNLTADGTVSVKKDGNDRITLTPNGTSDSLVKVLGNIQTFNNTTKKTQIGSDGSGSFNGTVTGAAFAGDGVSSTVVGTVVKRDNSGNFTAGTITASMNTSLTAGTDIDGSSYNGGTARTFAVISSTTENGKIVKRDANGNFSAGTITASLTGNITGSSTYANSSGTTNEGTSSNVGNKLVRRSGSGYISVGSLSAGYSTFDAVTQHSSNDYIRIGGGPSYDTIQYMNLDDHPELYDVCAKFQRNVFFKGWTYIASDRRIKDEITTIDQKHSLDVIGKLRPVSFKRMSDAEFVLGYIGQEIAEIIPPAVNCNGREPIANIYIYGVITKVKSITDNEGRECVSVVIELEKSLQEEIKNKKDVIFSVGIQGMGGRSRNLIYHPELCDDPTDMSIELLDYNEDEPFDKDTRILVFGEIVTDVHAVDYNEVFVVVSSAVKELNDIRKEDRSRIETLENQVSQLLARVEALESN